LFALSFMNLTAAGTHTSAFEQIFISSFQEQTLFSISVPQINHFEVRSLDSTNSYGYSLNITEDISIPYEVSQMSVNLKHIYTLTETLDIQNCGMIMNMI